MRVALVDLFDQFANLSNLGHEVRLESFICHQAVCAVSDSTLGLILDRVAVKEASTSEPGQVLAVGVRAEDESAVCNELDRLVRVREDLALLEALHVLALLTSFFDCTILSDHEGEGLTWGV